MNRQREKEFKDVVNFVKEILKTELSDKQAELIAAFLVDIFYDSTKNISSSYKELITKTIMDRVKNSDPSSLISEFDDYLTALLSRSSILNSIK